MAFALARCVYRRIEQGRERCVCIHVVEANPRKSGYGAIRVWLYFYCKVHVVHGRQRT